MPAENEIEIGIVIKAKQEIETQMQKAEAATRSAEGQMRKFESTAVKAMKLIGGISIASAFYKMQNAIKESAKELDKLTGGADEYARAIVSADTAFKGWWSSIAFAIGHTKEVREFADAVQFMFSEGTFYESIIRKAKGATSAEQIKETREELGNLLALYRSSAEEARRQSKDAGILSMMFGKGGEFGGAALAANQKVGELESAMMVIAANEKKLQEKLAKENEEKKIADGKVAFSNEKSRKEAESRELSAALASMWEEQQKEWVEEEEFWLGIERENAEENALEMEKINAHKNEVRMQQDLEYLQTLERNEQFALDTQRGFVDALISSWASFFETIASGGDAFQSFGKTLLGMLGNLAIMMGQFFIAVSLAGAAIPFFGWTGLGGVAAGAALVALGGLMKGLAGRGGGVPQTSRYSGSGYGQSQRAGEWQPYSSNNASQQGTMGNTVTINIGNNLDSAESIGRRVYQSLVSAGQAGYAPSFA